MPFAMRIPMANLWLFEGLIMAELSKNSAGNAVLRTTTAPTMLRAGVKENVLAQKATATVNFRIKPGETTKTVEQHIRDVVADDRVEVTLREGASEPSPVSPTDHPGFEHLARTIAEVIPGAATAPQLMIAASDARYFYEISDAVYRFMPLYLTLDDIERIHGTNERIGKQQLGRAVVFYRRLLEHALAQ
jgi:carboxypeptidase PM20D1